VKPPAAIKAERITKTLGGLRVLDDVSLDGVAVVLAENRADMADQGNPAVQSRQVLGWSVAKSAWAWSTASG
jgi:hypothetical protein